jgi:O-antigen biosynthesis protein
MPAPRVLVLDDRVPYDVLGTGYPRARRIVEALRDGGYDVLFYPVITASDSAPLDYGIEGVEILYDRGIKGLARTFAALAPTLDVVWVSRPHNMRYLASALAKRTIANLWQKPKRAWKLVYDAEAIFSERDALRAQLAGAPVGESAAADRLSEEMRLTQGCAALAVVSGADANTFARYFDGPIETISHALTVEPTQRPFAQRDALLSVGPLQLDTPNEDALLWYCREVQPRLSHLFVHAGVMESDRLAKRAPRGVCFMGVVPDLVPLYERARIFIAPTRFAAGIPLKVADAAAHGVPIVATPLLARQLGWEHERELLVAETPDEWVAAIERLWNDEALWQRLRERALAATERDFSADRFAQRVLHLVDAVRNGG